jgi:O-antigen/teichoic acid export membrane protein
MSDKANAHLTSGRLLARNTVWNLIGLGAPVLVAVFCIPVLVRTLGNDRFGVLALAWSLIGYASLFDLGLGRALTQMVAKKLGAGQQQEVPRIVWTSLMLMLALGILGGAVMIAVAPWLVRGVLKVPQSLRGETVRAFFLLGLSVPVVITTAGLRGLLEAHQRFDLATWIRVPMGVFTFVGPLMVLPFSHSLVPVVGILVVGRVIGCVGHAWMALRVAPELRDGTAWDRHWVAPLMRFGGWMTVTNVVGPLMVTLDRFLIGAWISMAAVAYYATPYEVVTKLLLIPTAIVGVMFPAFSTSLEGRRERAALLYGRSLKYMFAVLLPIIVLIVVLARNGLTLWLGNDFADHSTRVVQWLALGVLANSLACVPFSFVQGAGRPDLTAKLHLVELPIYLLTLAALVHANGIEGAAVAWSARATCDSLALFLMARKFVSPGATMVSRAEGLPVGRPAEM